METWEIVLAGFIFILFIVGIIIGIYFLYRNNTKKTPTDTGNGDTPSVPLVPTGDTPSVPLVPPGDTPSVPLVPPGGSTTPPATGDNFPKNTNFSIIARNVFIASASPALIDRREVFLYSQYVYIGRSRVTSGQFAGLCEQYYWQYKDVTRNNQPVPNAIEFQYTNPGQGILYPSSKTFSNYKIGNTFQRVNTLVIDDGSNIPTSSIPRASWIFKGGKICLQNEPSKCLYISSDPNQVGSLTSSNYSNGFTNKGVVVLADDTNNTDPGFIWKTDAVASPTNSVCRAN